MIQRWRTASVTGAVFLTCCASAARAADLPPTVRQASSADAERAAITAYVKSQFALVAGTDAKKAGAAREEISRQVETTQTVVPSASFQTEYVRAVIDNVGPLIAASADINKRLNGAIIVSRLSKATVARALVPVTQTLMKDPSPAVAMWGVKGGGALLPQTMSVPAWRNGQTVTKSIVEAVKSHPDAGPLVQTAYDALYLTEASLPADAFKACAGGMNELLALRTSAYQSAVPTSPQVERIAPVYFILPDIRKAILSDSNLKVTTVQNLLNLLHASAEHLPSASAGDQQSQLLGIVTSYAGALKVLFDAQSQPAVARLFEPIAGNSRLPLSPNVPQQIAAAVTAVQALPDYKAIKAP